MFNRDTFTIAYTDLFLPLVLISTNIQIGKISSEVMCSTRVSIPIIISKRLRVCKESLHIRVTGVGVIIALITCECHVTKLATDLASGTRTIGGWTTATIVAVSRSGAARLRIIGETASTAPTKGTTTASKMSTSKV